MIIRPPMSKLPPYSLLPTPYSLLPTPYNPGLKSLIKLRATI
ncbi:hypothetical protein [Moorena producens]|nr:hypothetical protein [Moorena producens]